MKRNGAVHTGITHSPGGRTRPCRVLSIHPPHRGPRGGPGGRMEVGPGERARYYMCGARPQPMRNYGGSLTPGIQPGVHDRVEEVS